MKLLPLVIGAIAAVGALVYYEEKKAQAAPAVPANQGATPPAGVPQMLAPSATLPPGAMYGFTGTDGKIVLSTAVNANGMAISAIPVGALIDNGSDILYQKSTDGNAYFVGLDS